MIELTRQKLQTEGKSNTTHTHDQQRRSAAKVSITNIAVKALLMTRDEFADIQIQEVTLYNDATGEKAHMKLTTRDDTSKVTCKFANITEHNRDTFFQAVHPKLNTRF